MTNGTNNTSQRAIALKIVAEVLGRVTQFGTLGLVAHTLSLSDFGEYSLALVIGFLMAQLADSGLHLLITRQLGRTQDNKFLTCAFTNKLCILLALLVLFGTVGWFLNYSLTFSLLVVSSLIYSLSDFSFAIFRSRNQLHYEAGLIIFYRVLLLGGTLFVFLAGLGLIGIAGIYLVATILTAAIALKLTEIQLIVQTPDFQMLRRAFPIGLAIMLSLLAFKIDVPLLQLLTRRAEETGLYNAAYKLFEPLLLFPAALMAGLFPGLSKSAHFKDNVHFKQQIRQLILVLSCSGIIVGGGVALVAGWAVPLLFGSDYNGAVMTLELLALAVPFLFVNSGLTHALLALDLERLYLYFFGICLIVNIGANCMLIPYWGRNGAAVATILTEIVLTILCSKALQVNLKLKTPQAKFPLTLSALRLKVQIEQLGFGLLLALILCLPFELNQLPFLSFEPWLILNNLKLVYYLNILVALLTLWKNRHAVKSYVFNWRKPAFWLGCLILASTVSTVFSFVPKESLKFIIDLGFGAVLWLAIPFWLVERRFFKLKLISYCLVATAAISACLGLLEFVPGLNLDSGFLSFFKVGATVAGPFLRLSGTFEYANIAAIFYELVLPFAISNLCMAVSDFQSAQSRKRDKSWWQIVIWVFACGLLWEALLLSFSRSALPGMLITTPLLFWFTRREISKLGKSGLGLGLGLGLALIGLSLLISPVLVLRFKTQSDQGWYLASYDTPPLGRLSACQQIEVPVQVHNLTPLDWAGGPTGAYHLSYHWLDQPDHIYRFEGIRSVMPSSLKAGQQTSVQAQLRTPDKAGHYWLVWDMVEEDVSWFSLKSASYQKQAVEIVTANTSTCNLPPPSTGTSKLPSSLPQVPPNPERSQLWKVAVQMILKRPVLGVGPDAYRFAYGGYAGLKVWDTRIFANSTPLELAADLGIAGLLLWSIFAGMATWPLIQKGWGGRLGLVEAATLTGLVAFGLHSLLDYFFGFHAIYILMWILLGLANQSHSLKPVASQQEGGTNEI